ncbi:hypothetical protein F9288_11220 [Sphingomonas sp. CL5.1]|uniref:hypothetical protein n=1 Tax=Sphingomonas sp. CL5.1 TaxID=2653203 RepID=UPI001583B8EF|nr:hypothetical protein [Sphingomonas sp. CL5.1]QKS00135.1 hypothetical protein F9288_11220 [Sphingomonas sp. CL5.1]
MDYNADEQRRRREYDAALGHKRRLEAKMAELDRKARAAKARLLATTKSEQWHRMTLGWLDRDAGYTGEMASARVWLRSVPVATYTSILAAYVEIAPNATNIQIEVMAVRDHLDDWTQKGDALLLARARRDYDAECVSFAQWERDNPDKGGWRSQKSTRAQWMLIGRTATALGIEAPMRLNRGDAHEWLKAHGGNVRLGGTANNTDDSQIPDAGGAGNHDMLPCRESQADDAGDAE